MISRSLVAPRRDAKLAFMLAAVMLAICNPRTWVEAHPKNYVAKSCDPPQLGDIIMGNDVASGNAPPVVTCTEAQGGKRECSAEYPAPVEMLLFVRDATTGASVGADIDCGEAALNGHDHDDGHDHRLLSNAESNACGHVACSNQAVYSTRASKKFAKISIQASDQANLTLISAGRYGKAFLWSSPVSEITTTSEDAEGSAAISLHMWIPGLSFIVVVAASVLQTNNVVPMR